MKLRDYMAAMDKLIKDNPKALEFEVVSSSDDEGNSFRKVFYTPTLGFFDGDEFEGGAKNPNAVCVN